MSETKTYCDLWREWFASLDDPDSAPIETSTKDDNASNDSN